MLFGKPFGGKTPSPQPNPVVEERILAIRDTSPENLKQTPRSRSSCITSLATFLCNIVQRLYPVPCAPFGKSPAQFDRITHVNRRKRKSLQRSLPLEEIQMDFNDISTVPKSETGKQQYVVETFNFVDAGTSILLDAQVQADFHTALDQVAALTSALLVKDNFVPER